MAGISVYFNMIDQMSSKIEEVANAGSRLIEKFNGVESSVSEAMSGIEHSAEEVTVAIDKATESAEMSNEAVKNMTEATEGFVGAEAEMGDALDKVSNTTEKARDGLGRFKKQTDESTESSEKFGDKTTKAMIGLEDVIMTLGIAETLNVIISAFNKASEAATKFESSLAVVNTIADSNVLKMGEISSQIKDLSRNTAQGVDSLAEATYGAISASVDTADAVAFVGEANELAIGGFTKQAIAVDVLTTSLNAYNMSAEDTGKVSDYLITTQNLGKTSVDKLASSMGMVIPTAAAFGVKMDNLSTAYAIMTANGVQTAQSTTYLKSMMAELANTSSEVSAVLEEKTGSSFSQLMEQGYSLGDVMKVLGDSVDGDTTAFMNLWSSMEAGAGAVTLYNAGAEKYASVLDQMQNSAGATEIAYEKMTDTTEYSNQRLENSYANLAIAFGSDLNPIVREFNMGLADIVDGFADLIDKHPAVSAVITGTIAGLSAVVLGLTAYNVKMKVSFLLTTKWAAALNAAIWPATLIFGVVGAATAALVYYNNVLEDAIDEQYIYTDATMRQKEELDSLKNEYEQVIAVQGEESEEALRLRYQIDELSASYESGKQTIDEFAQQCTSAAEAQAKANEDYENSLKAIRDNEIGTLALVQKLDDLSESTENSSQAQAQMEAIIGGLNQQIDGLNLSYDDLINNQEISLATIRAMAEEDAKKSRAVEQQEKYNEAVKNSIIYDEDHLRAAAELAAAQERKNAAQEKFDELLKRTGGAPAAFGSLESRELDKAEENLRKLTEAFEAAESTLKSNADTIKEIEQEWSEAGMTAEQAAEKQVSAAEAVGAVIADTKGEVEEIAASYDKAYEKALESVQGQYSLWQEVDEVVAMTSADISNALQSQIDYWTSYNANLEMLTEKSASIEGLTEVLTKVADGSEDSAAMIQGMAQMSDEELSAMVEQYKNLQSSQSATSDKMAELESGFSDALDSMRAEMESAVSDMNMSDDAADAATATMNAYINAIKSKTPEVNSALSAISLAKPTLNLSGAYAEGTLDAAPGLALVGEKGPELINFRGGEVVYTASETASMLSGQVQSNEFYIPPSSNSQNDVVSEKTVTLKIEGSGEIKVDRNGVNKEEVLGVLMENIKGALMNILREEILEEGELSYEF